MNKFTLSRNLGFITGPLMLILGIASYSRGVYPPISILMIIMGLIRIGLTIYSVVMSNRPNQDQ